MRNKRLKLSVILLSGFLLTAVQAQEAIPAAGGNASGSGGTASYSVGQVAYQAKTGTGGSVTEGVQQSYEIIEVTGVEITGINLSVSAYPNPVSDYLTITVEDIELSSLTYQLYDMQGSLLQNEKITGNQTSVAMGNLVSATYFIKITQNNKEIKTFKIVKK